LGPDVTPDLVANLVAKLEPDRGWSLHIAWSLRWEDRTLITNNHHRVGKSKY
jgi:hypothetical protein